MRILGIESSCDETAAAIVEDGRRILSNVIASQADEHKQYGGVVPELASRRHCENILPVVKKALADAGMTLDEVDAVAVTYAPGLIGALLVGVSFAKGLAMMSGKPLIPVHHTEGHAAANYLVHPELKPPYLGLIVSGGHTRIAEVLDYTEFRTVGKTRDDAAGECFDKCARAMGFPYPGGVHVDQAAQRGNASAFKLPRIKMDGNPYDFSFSGLKTYIVNLLHNTAQKGETLNTDDLAAALQHEIACTLTDKAVAAAKELGYKVIALSGGVSANSGVRSTLAAACEQNGITLYQPPIALCGDNAAMIASQGYYNYLAGITADESLNALASKELRGESRKAGSPA
ncbi:MAG: tRNA (adenosine(37)-N6)-threonylcarbamoyltransferase complex transferase subunit TsaD [Oscillospiraceae bacterium]|nr:tRNA (adenosine(37)-N6)-threonylcarbamoyltransferase complex transferase subunit TsaD [Oscillospiraceae bacterium]